MNTEEALKILIEMQKWRRSETPYDKPNTMPFSPEQCGKAIDVAIRELRLLNENTN